MSQIYRDLKSSSRSRYLEGFLARFCDWMKILKFKKKTVNNNFVFPLALSLWKRFRAVSSFPKTSRLSATAISETEV